MSRVKGKVYSLKESRLCMPEGETEIAYLAGFFDGEGCVGMYVTNNVKYAYTQFHVSIDQSDWSIMEWLLDIGGVVTENKGSFHTTKPSWRWRVHREAEVSEFLEAIWPYLKVKSDKVGEVLTELEKRNTIRRMDNG